MIQEHFEPVHHPAESIYSHDLVRDIIQNMFQVQIDN